VKVKPEPRYRMHQPPTDAERDTLARALTDGRVWVVRDHEHPQAWAEDGSAAVAFVVGSTHASRVTNALQLDDDPALRARASRGKEAPGG
jgi:hypothetical protein